MAVFLRTDNHLNGGERLARFVESVAEGAVEHVKDQVTRVDVYLGDENSAAKSSDHQFRCSMEARIGGLKPLAVTNYAGSIDDAVRGAADKLQAVIDSTIERIGQKKGRMSFAGDPDAEMNLPVSS
ncbi:MAG TPA: hypothetical protein VM452_14440 [Caulifigura sp.]|jgi:hypothetical protein|nr:hypothetical protein [Caulifigura sp.]